MIRNLPPRSHPHALLLRNILHELAQRLGTTWFPSDTRVKRDGHHLATLAIQAVECIFEVRFVSVACRAGEAGTHMELAIVA